jgi:4-diphosphocytidyl-2-C-methyl-D-erythritol kinase
VAPVREFAPAKINLTLGVAGRREDGLHEIASLVVFATVGDRLTLDPAPALVLNPGDDSRVAVSGPFAGALSGTNILDRALAAIRAQAPELVFGSVHLEKHLPVAAGIGGGSADAGALLRAARRIIGAGAEGIDWQGIAAGLGADVPACLAARPLWMTGAGAVLTEVPGGMPALAAVLVNPLAAVPADKTARVFRALGASAVPADYVAPAAPRFADRASVLAFMRARGNDLACAAETVVPETGAALAALGAFADCAYAAVSGAGPTCFGIFADARAAETAQARLAVRHPTWWTAAATLG